jgi:hypothetical protein
MRDPGAAVHVRLMVTRGLKPTPYQAPATTLGKPTVVVLPEHKRAAAAPKASPCSPALSMHHAGCGGHSLRGAALRGAVLHVWGDACSEKCTILRLCAVL